ncbi:TPA: hypothetical protein ACGZNB_005105 [Escherichia coli]
MIRKLLRKLFGRRRPSPVELRRGDCRRVIRLRKRYHVHCDTDLLS